MLCEKCGKNNATTHIHSIVNGIVTEKYLCSSCAAKEGFGAFESDSLTNMLSSMFGDALSLNRSVSEKRCKCCGISFSDIAESGKVGCPECYKTFYSELIPYLKRVHGSTKHSGKIPNKAPLVVKSEKDTVESLKIRLAGLIKDENFEEAAKVRDEIKKLEEEKK